MHTIRADDGLLDLAHSLDFGWLIQLLEWREVEPAPGEYFWEYADWLVRAAEYYDLDLVLRVDHPPQWALTMGQGLPVEVEAYAEFMGEVARRYQGRIAAYVIWNEPNLALEWNGRPPDAEGYVQLLCAAQTAVQAEDPGAIIVSAGLAPTNDRDASATDDRLYLQQMYAAGAGACFDVLGAHPYGFAYSPDDEYGAHDGLNYARLADLRAIMRAEGDSHKAVWATELGWTTDPVGRERQWLRVSQAEQERYLADAIEKAAKEWPWLERTAIWNLSRGLAADDERRGYSLVLENGQPTPGLERLAAMTRAQGAGREPPPTGEKRNAQPVEILAPDVAIRLSDVDTFYPHWARPHCGSVPCRRWAGQFYVVEPGSKAWQLRMEIMQVEEPGNLVWINGQLLHPPGLPLRGRPDFASVWTAVDMPLPASLLQAGVNEIQIESSPRLPAYQDSHARFESLQLRNIRLAAPAPEPTESDAPEAP